MAATGLAFRDDPRGMAVLRRLAAPGSEHAAHLVDWVTRVLAARPPRSPR